MNLPGWRHKKVKKTLLWGVLGVFLSVGSAFAQPEVTGVVTVGKAGDSRSYSLGFVADDKGHVLARIDAPGEALFVTAADGAEYAARQVDRDPTSGMALLKIASGTDDLEPYPFARDEAELQRKIYAFRGAPAAADASVVSGSLANIQPPQDGRPRMYLHNALVGDQGLGSPLLNNCGEVVGVVVPKPGVLSRLFGGDDSDRTAYAVPIDLLQSRFASKGLNPVRASAGCLSEADQAAAAKAKAEEERAEAEAKAREEERKRRELERKAADEAAKAAAEEERAAAAAAAAAEAAAAAAEAQERLDALQRELEQKADATEEERARLEEEMELRRQEIARAEEQRRLAEEAKAKAEEEAKAREQQYLLWGAIGGGLLLLVLILIWVLKQRSVTREREAKAAAQANAEQAQAVASAAQADLEAKAADEARIAAVPTVFFDMVDHSGQRFAVRVPGPSIASATGAMVGRSPGDSDFVINHAEVSRKHFRLFTDGRLLLIEDQGSTNGTVVDGKALSNGEETVLVDRSQVQIGDLVLDVRLEQD